MAETNGLLNRRAVNAAPRVRIPPSPPFLQTYEFADVHRTLIFLAYLLLLKAGAFAPVRRRPRKSMVLSMVSARSSMVSEARVLNDAKIKAAKPREAAYRLGDSGQLYLQVTPSGGKHWRMNYTFGRNSADKPVQKTLSFGSYPAVSLLGARAKRDEAKRLLSQGRDPAEERRATERAESVQKQNSFRAAMEGWFELHSGWSLEKLRELAALNEGKWSHVNADRWTTDHLARWSAVHSGDVLVSLERDVLPFIGDEPIAELKAPAILALLRVVEKRGAIETAHRLRQRISGVFVYGIAAGLCNSDPAATLAKALKPVPESKHQPSIVDEESDQDGRIRAVRQMLLDCEAQRCRGQTKLALRLLALTAVRPGDLTGACWAEFVDLDGNSPTWVIPASRRKGIKVKKGSPDFNHHVPLSWQAVDVLTQLKRLTGKFQLCFPGERQVNLSNGVQTGPPIGVEEGPPCGYDRGLSR